LKGISFKYWACAYYGGSKDLNVLKLEYPTAIPGFMLSSQLEGHTLSGTPYTLASSTF